MCSSACFRRLRSGASTLLCIWSLLAGCVPLPERQGPGWYRDQRQAAERCFEEATWVDQLDGEWAVLQGPDGDHCRADGWWRRAAATLWQLASRREPPTEAKVDR